jgi:cytochrome c-type biogenesis protein CcmE
MERRLRLLWLGTVIVASLLATLLLTPPEGSLSVDDVMSDPDQRKGDSISVRGIVENGTYNSTTGAFTLSGEQHGMAVKIGASQLSAAFSEGKTILVTGEFTQDGEIWTIHAEDIQVGCPSKYEAAEDNAATG